MPFSCVFFFLELRNSQTFAKKNSKKRFFFSPCKNFKPSFGELLKWEIPNEMTSFMSFSSLNLDEVVDACTKRREKFKLKFATIVSKDQIANPNVIFQQLRCLLWRKDLIIFGCWRFQSQRGWIFFLFNWWHRITNWRNWHNYRMKSI